jgi:hypothetical protein
LMQVANHLYRNRRLFPEEKLRCTRLRHSLCVNKTTVRFPIHADR